VLGIAKLREDDIWSKIVGVLAQAGKEHANNPEVAVEQKEMLPQLEGFAMDAALGRLAGSKPLYRKLLVNFFEKYSGVAEEIRHNVEAGQIENALRQAHTIKGLAASMGHEALSAAAAAVEHAVNAAHKDSSLVPAIGQPLQHFATVHDSVMATLAAAFGANQEAQARPAPVAPVDYGALRQDLLKFEQLLDASDGEASDLFEHLEDKVRGIDADLHAMLKQAVRDFDYDAAIRLVEVLRDKLP